MTVLDTRVEPRLVRNLPSLLPLLCNLSRLGPRSLLHPPTTPSLVPHPSFQYPVNVLSTSSALGVTYRLGTASHAVRLVLRKAQNPPQNVTSKACTSYIDMGHDILQPRVSPKFVLVAGKSRQTGRSCRRINLLMILVFSQLGTCVAGAKIA
jgi:hypothetical protein